MMNKVKEIIKFSFFKYFQNKWFILFNVITLLSIVISLNYSALSSFFEVEKEEKKTNIEIVDNNNLLYEKFVENFSGDTKFEVSKIDQNV